MKWRTKMRYGKVVGADIRVGKFCMSVHHYIGCGDTWYMSCYGIFNKIELGEISLNDAKVMAASKLQLELEKAIKIITG